MTPSLPARLAHLGSLSGANAVALLAGFAATMAVLRLLDRVEFAAWAVAMSVLGLASTIPQATGPGCARWLARDPRAGNDCRRVRFRAAWTAGFLLAAFGTAWSFSTPNSVTPLAWLLLGLQIPATAAESHRSQSLQMGLRFHHQALFLPLSRLSKAALLWAAVAWGGQGIETVALLQLGATVLPLIRPWRSGLQEERRSPGGEFLRLWKGNFVSGLMVWGGTRSTILVLDARGTPEGTASYGIADTLCSSLQMPLQALGTILQPRLYSWTPGESSTLLWRSAIASTTLGILLCAAAFVAGPTLLSLLAGHADPTSQESLEWLGFGIVAVGIAMVPGTLLQRLGAGFTIGALEALSAGCALGVILFHPNPGAPEAALAWSLGRWVWAVGATLAAIHRSLAASSKTT